MDEPNATLHVGKAGITDAFVAELKSVLKDKKIVRVRFLKSARAEKDRKALAEELAETCRAELVRVRGNTAILKKR